MRVAHQILRKQNFEPVTHGGTTSTLGRSKSIVILIKRNSLHAVPTLACRIGLTSPAGCSFAAPLTFHNPHLFAREGMGRSAPGSTTGIIREGCCGRSQDRNGRVAARAVGCVPSRHSSSNSGQPIGGMMIQVIKPEAVIGVIEYKGFSLVPSQVGKGWRVNIFDPGSTAARRESPCVLEPCAAADVLKDARKKWTRLLILPGLCRTKASGQLDVPYFVESPVRSLILRSPSSPIHDFCRGKHSSNQKCTLPRS